jgi:probable rRNA maturation factor
VNTLEVMIEASVWDGVPLDAVAQRAVTTTLCHMQLAPDACEVTVLACDDARIVALNGEFRDKPTPTNVLSWPSQPLAPPAEGMAPPPPEQGFDGMIELGDIALGFETCAREAAEADKPLEAHLTHLIVHATLHLLGYDHVTDGDAALMERLEVEILGNLGLDDPYSEDE